MSIELDFEANGEGNFPVVSLYWYFRDGRWVTRHFSETYSLNLAKGDKKTICLRYDELLLGAGKYTFSAAIYKNLILKTPQVQSSMIYFHEVSNLKLFLKSVEMRAC